MQAPEQAQEFNKELKNYKVIKQLGKGSFSVVYLAIKRSKISESYVALKMSPISQLQAAAEEVKILNVIYT